MNSKAKKKLRAGASKGITYLVLIGLSITFLLPFFWMLSTSLKENSQLWTEEMIWIPDPIVWGNYVEAFTILPFGLYFANTFFLVFCNVIGQIFSCSMAGFGFARLRFPGKSFLFMLLLSTMMVPSIVTLIPTFIYFTKLGWTNTFLPLIIPKLFATPFYTFLMRQFYMSLPKELDEAARIDGCSNFRIYWNILLPLTIPSLAAIAVFTFMGTWNDYMGPLLYLQNPDNYTVSLGLSFFRGARHIDWQYLMAASAISMVPCLILFAVAQKHIIGGISMSGLKG